MNTVVLFVFGVVLLLLGGRSLVAAAVDAALRFRVQPLLIGLTLVAWGTSFPELAFNLSSALQGKPDLVLGNVIGANICNLGLVLGVSALFAPLLVSASVVRREIPLMVAMFALLLGLSQMRSIEYLLGGRLGPLLLLTAFAAYSIWTLYTGLRERGGNQPLAEQTAASEIAQSRRPIWLLALMIVGGIALLGWGGSLASSAASGIARVLGLSDRVIGLTVVAVGTTLPELITCVLAVRRQQVDLAVGNAVGSCVFNVGAILALCQLIHPAPTPAAAVPSLICMLLLGVLLIPFSRTFAGHIARIEGLVLLLLQASFIVFELLRAR